MKVQSVLKLIILYYFYFKFLQAELLVKISQGFLIGTTFGTRNSRNISAFLGIPYAQPPVGEFRFSNPVPKKSWDGIRSAKKESNVCAQMSHENIKGDEDCLYLNVYTPVLEFNSSIVNNKLLAVMVWIHGGGFQVGSSSPTSYGPKYLLDKDIVLVSMNYRLGIFGFLSTGDEIAPGNFGLKDQVLALKWVQQNIKNFGGDPNRVTIFGASAGGASVNLHALSNATNGLFHQYIIQSGSVLSPWAYRNRTHYKPYLNDVAKNIGCSTINSSVFINCLRKASVEKLLNALKYDSFDFPILHWVPTDESKSEEAFLIDSPENLISENKMKDLPFMSGTVADEGLLLTLRLHANKTYDKPIKHLVEKCINSTSNHYLKPEDIPKFRKTIEDHYFNKSIHSLPEDKLLNNYTNFVSDSGFLYPQVILVEKMAKVQKSPFYFYSFGYFSINMSSIFTILNIKDNLGVAHAEEVSYLFPHSNISTISEKDEKILNLMIDFWTSFAINGKPTSDHLEDPNIWLPYTQNNSFLQIGNIFNNTDPCVTRENDYFSSRMDFWKRQFPVL